MWNSYKTGPGAERSQECSCHSCVWKTRHMWKRLKLRECQKDIILLDNMKEQLWTSVYNLEIVAYRQGTKTINIFLKPSRVQVETGIFFCHLSLVPIGEKYRWTVGSTDNRRWLHLEADQQQVEKMIQHIIVVLLPWEEKWTYNHQDYREPCGAKGSASDMARPQQQQSDPLHREIDHRMYNCHGPLDPPLQATAALWG